VSPALRIVFVCVENACRSQMAEAFARMHGGPGVEPYSAGSAGGGGVNPKAVAAMAELGYDLRTHVSKPLSALPEVGFDVAVTMGCGDACPTVRAVRREDWDIPDPKDLDLEGFREVRDLIGEKVRALLAELAAPAP
jgi:protein-tyrosine-phosphatase